MERPMLDPSQLKKQNHVRHNKSSQQTLPGNTQQKKSQNASSYRYSVYNTPSKSAIKRIYSAKLDISPSHRISRTPIKPTHLSELELENRSLKVEISQLKQLLNSTVSKSTPTKSTSNISEDYIRQTAYLEYLHKENQRLQSIINNYRSSKNKNIINILSKKVSALENENLRLKEEMMKNIKGVSLARNYIKNPYESIVSRIYRACCLSRVDIDELGYIINPDGLEEIDIGGIQRGLNAVKLTLSENEVKTIITMIIGYEVSRIPQQMFIDGLKSLNEGAVDYSTIKPDANLLRIAFAAAGVSKIALLEQFVDQKFTKESFIQSLITDGLKIKLDSIEKISNIVFEETNEMEAAQVFEIIFGLFDEIIVTPYWELEYEDQIVKTMENKWEKFLENCEEVDYESELSIDYEDYIKICDKLNISFSREVSEYLSVVFYGKIADLMKVPYLYYYFKYNEDNDI